MLLLCFELLELNNESDRAREASLASESLSVMGAASVSASMIEGGELVPRAAIPSCSSRGEHEPTTDPRALLSLSIWSVISMYKCAWERVGCC